MRLKSYVLTIHLGEGEPGLQTPTALWVILGWFKASAGITVKVWVSNILWLLVSIRKSIQLLKFLPVLLFFYGVDTAWGSIPQSTLQVLSVPAYVRNKALNPQRKIECTHAQMMGKSPDVQFGIQFSTWNVGCMSGKWGEISETFKRHWVDICEVERTRG